VRIPLDYYRILGLPLAASEEQLRQAYSDRIVQLPRREYSTAAITSRKQLIEEAYVVLSNPKERKEYDRLYVAHAYTPDSTNVAVAVEDRVATTANIETKSLSIEIDQDELVGALLILQELGEYEQVLKLGRPYLVNKSHAGSNNRHSTDIELGTVASERPDVVLTVALACLELGREQWQQGHYENAAISLETGEELLARETMFPSVRAEIESDLYRLRPYRILELLALPEDKTTERRQGLQLLQEILEDRSGIDGSGDDQSGLSIDDFLRFIQQLRHYLTVSEQHKIFEAESKRPSAVATYLAVYALIARGFTQRQPALIRQAKQMLTPLAKRQDVHLEQSLCYLLLGQTEEATRALELSQEYEALAFIRENSHDSPDLLPGLCLYGENWLQNEVFPHFRDLVTIAALLKDYFADEQVQAYLEALPADRENIANDWSGINRQADNNTHSNPRHNNTASNSRSNSYDNSKQVGVSQTPNQNRSEYPTASSDYTTPTNATSANGHAETSFTIASNVQSINRVPNQNDYGSANPTGQPQRPKRRKSQPSANSARNLNEQQRPTRRRRQYRSPEQPKIYLLLKVLATLGGILVFWLIVSTTFGWVRNLFSPAPGLRGEQLSIQINQPVIKIPDKSSLPQSVPGPLTKETATGVIQAWLSAKASSLGPNHEIDSLNGVLSGSALSYWRGIVLQVKSDGRYRKYEHQVSDVSIETGNDTQNHASVEASVAEVTTYYEKELVKKTDKDKVRVRYEFVRVDSAWRIREISLLNKIN
jgi:ARC6-like, IMS domain/DnaJ domain